MVNGQLSCVSCGQAPGADLDGNGVQITDLNRSTVFMEASGSGLQHRTAWAGDGVLFYDADGSGTINDDRAYVFTAWGARRSRNGPGDRFRQRTRAAPGTATDDLAALRSRFDTNGDGRLTGAQGDGIRGRWVA